MFERKSNYNILLNNGNIIPGSAVTDVMATLFDLKNSQADIYAEFVKKCNDSAYKMSGNAEEVITKLKLMKSGLVNEVTKNIVLSADQDPEFSPVKRMIPTAKL